MEYAILNEDGSITLTDDYKRAYSDDRADHKIKQQEYKNYFVSTIFLPLNHGFDNLCVHFETYVFPIKNGEVEWCEVWGKRNTTKSGALIDHEEAIRLIDAGEIEND